MRLWTLHPRYLDAKGLTAAWREALLAQKVLAGATRGYRRHPQLARFRAHRRPLDAIAAFLLYEWKHLRAKLRARSPHLYRELRTVTAPQAHPLFRIRPGGISSREKI